MLKLKVPDMSCGHCVASVTKAVQSIDAAASVNVDVSSRTVEVETTAELARVSQALEAAGYPASAA
ncbi:heavy-metal-associated domain-containing protein [Pseudaminobacter sp. 19-2017]|uniref:Heavy-metal-associated domain-containing protein n=1 Tax=Pseudaminobacter soli (ex Zhang et al. 2022) TaxID=2831468 RepID=A0A942E3S0_9HYPH|nr:heavy-metal-associated domain-containing protein [Pseudaminobacter soli]